MWQKALFTGCLLVLTAIPCLGCGEAATAEVTGPVSEVELTGVSSSNVTGGLLMAAAPAETDEPVEGPVSTWTYDESFNTGDGCASRTVSAPADGLLQVSLECDENIIWGNVADMYIYINGNQVAFDVGRDAVASWKGQVREGDSIEYKACAETHGDDCDVRAKAEYLRW